MSSFYVESFFEVFYLTLIVTATMLGFYYLFGRSRPVAKHNHYATQPYSGGKKVESQASFFKSTFFQYAIYFLIFDVVAFIVALAAISDPIEGGEIAQPDVLYPILYLFFVLLFFLILPKHEGEIL